MWGSQLYPFAVLNGTQLYPRFWRIGDGDGDGPPHPRQIGDGDGDDPPNPGQSGMGPQSPSPDKSGMGMGMGKGGSVPWRMAFKLVSAYSTVGRSNWHAWSDLAARTTA